MGRDVVEKYAAKKVELERIRMAAEQAAMREERSEEEGAYEENLKDKQAQILPELSNEINSWIAELCENFGEHDTAVPTLEFTQDGNYSYHVPSDDGTGTAQKSLILYDIAILSHSILPLLIHDSVLFSGLSHERLSVLLKLYAQQKKQVFIALDNQAALNPEAQELVKACTRLELAESPNSLFGFSSTEPDFSDRIDHGIPDWQLPKKRTGTSKTSGTDQHTSQPSLLDW